MNEVLRPCPFCGGAAIVKQEQVTTKSYKPVISIDDYSIGRTSERGTICYKVVCKKCKGMVGLYSTRKAAVESWNRRTSDERERTRLD